MQTHMRQTDCNLPCGKLGSDIIGRAQQARLSQSATKKSQLAQTDRTYISVHPPASHITRVSSAQLNSRELVILTGQGQRKNAMEVAGETWKIAVH
jgi:hypothetical protein